MKIETIEVLLNDGNRVTAPILYRKGIFLVINQIDCGKLVKGYQVCLDDGDYPKVVGITCKRRAITLANFMAKAIKNEKSLLYKNKYYIGKIIKPLLLDWLLDRKLYNSTLGHTPISDL